MRHSLWRCWIWRHGRNGLSLDQSAHLYSSTMATKLLNQSISVLLQLVRHLLMPELQIWRWDQRIKSRQPCSDLTIPYTWMMEWWTVSEKKTWTKIPPQTIILSISHLGTNNVFSAFNICSFQIKQKSLIIFLMLVHCLTRDQTDFVSSGALLPRNQCFLCLKTFLYIFYPRKINNFFLQKMLKMFPKKIFFLNFGKMLVYVQTDFVSSGAVLPGNQCFLCLDTFLFIFYPRETIQFSKDLKMLYFYK